MAKTSSSENISKSWYEKVYYTDVGQLSGHFTSTLHFYRLKKILEIHSPLPTDTVVDLGSAWGELCFALAGKCGNMVGIDFSEKITRFCNGLLRKGNYRHVSFFCADAQYTAIKPGTVNVAIAADLFEHLYPDQFCRTLDECRRILKTGGKLIIWTPHRGHIIECLKNNDIILKHDPAHVDYKSMQFMKTGLQKRNFAILKSYFRESHIPVFNIIERLLLPFLPLFRRRIAILAEKLPD
jgi:cyclopropane fatty-acyl-phospholipid synthase-like methyltransferase